MINADKYTFSTPAVLPDGHGGFTPCPELLTGDEAIRYLRLDTVGHKNPSTTLRYYRERQKLRATQVGRKLFYSKKELDRLIENLTQS
jgi:hypothetical protein